MNINFVARRINVIDVTGTFFLVGKNQYLLKLFGEW